MMIEHFGIECFIAIAQTGSFTKASERLGRTQSAVSQQIAKIESQLSKSLFVRGKHIRLTPDGELFYPYAKKIHDLHQEAVAQLTRHQVTGEVKFGLPEDFIVIFLDQVLTEFAQNHPHVTINVECDLSLNLKEKFDKHEFDMILLKMDQPEDLKNATEVWSEKLDWVGDKLFSYTRDQQSPLPLVLSPEPCLYRSRTLLSLNEASIPWRLAFTSSSFNSKIAAVKAGLGVTVLPRSMVPQTLRSLNHIGLPHLDDTHIALLKHHENNPVVSTFEEFIIKKLKH